MKKMTWIWLVILILFVAGCSMTKSGSERAYDTEINNHEGGIVILYLGLQNESATETASGDAPASTDVSPTTAVGLQGSTASIAEEGAEQVLRDFSNIFKNWIENKKEEIIPPLQPEDPEEPVQPPLAPPTGDEDEEPPVVDTGDLDRIENLEYWQRPNGRPQWYGDFSKTMADYGAPVYFEVPGCGDLLMEENNGIRYEKDGWIVKESDVDGRGLTLLAPASCNGTEASVLYKSSD